MKWRQFNLRSAFVLCTLVAVGFAIWKHRQVTRPMRELAAGIEELGISADQKKLLKGLAWSPKAWRSGLINELSVVELTEPPKVSRLWLESFQKRWLVFQGQSGARKIHLFRSLHRNAVVGVVSDTRCRLVAWRIIDVAPNTALRVESKGDLLTITSKRSAGGVETQTRTFKLTSKGRLTEVWEWAEWPSTTNSNL